jgi:hypothetical protein
MKKAWIFVLGGVFCIALGVGMGVEQGTLLPLLSAVGGGGIALAVLLYKGRRT